MSTLSDLKERLLPLYQRLVAGHVYEMPYGRTSVKRKGELGFLKRVVKRSTPEEDFLTSLDVAGRTVYDIGGHIGIVAVVFAKAVGPTGQVVVFEPNENNCLLIQEHLRLNQAGNVRLVRLGIGDEKKGGQTLIVRNNESATGSLDKNIQAQIIGEGNFRQLQIDIDTLDGAAAAYGLPKPDLIKIDVEGMEYQALLGMSETIRNHSPQLYIEIHGADESSKRENIRRIAGLLQSWGYSLWHVESQQSITPGNCAAAREGHIFCGRQLSASAQPMAEVAHVRPGAP